MQSKKRRALIHKVSVILSLFCYVTVFQSGYFRLSLSSFRTRVGVSFGSILLILVLFLQQEQLLVFLILKHAKIPFSNVLVFLLSDLLVKLKLLNVLQFIHKLVRKAFTFDKRKWVSLDSNSFDYYHNIWSQI